LGACRNQTCVPGHSQHVTQQPKEGRIAVDDDRCVLPLTLEVNALAFSHLRRSRSVTVDLKDGFGKGTWGFLGQIVSDTARDEPVCVFARKLLGISACVRMWCAIGVTLKGNGGHGDDRSQGKAFFQIVILGLAFSEASRQR
jgi:hypothetical protein